jgi:predicted nucleic acid-binding protein
LSFLLDTNAVSEPGRPAPDPAFMAWLASINSTELYISTLALGELRRGIALLDDGPRRRSLEGLTSALVTRFARHVLPVDERVASVWGGLSARLRRSGLVIGAVDELIAATALAHNLTLVTRNRRHFEGIGCAMLSPWTAVSGA